MKYICEPTTASGCNSAKYHLPVHWLDTRLELGCSANEKSLERKLDEAQKKYFRLTNGKQGAQVVVPNCSRPSNVLLICTIVMCHNNEQSKSTLLMDALNVHFHCPFQMPFVLSPYI